MKTHRLLISVAVFCLALSSLALANGLNLNSLGTRALSMGGAFVGLADDFSAVYWNPAGIARFKKQYFGFYGTDVIPAGTYLMQAPSAAGLVTVVDAKTQTKHYLSGMAAYYYPFSDSLTAGLAVYIPSGLGSSWDGEDFVALQNYTLGIQPPQSSAANLWESRVGLVTFSPALGIELNEMISLGAALNINYGMFSLKRWAGRADIPVPPNVIDLGQYEDNQKGWGFGATLGILVRPNETLSLGAAVRTASKVHFAGETTISNVPLLGYKESSDSERDITWPWWAAAGVAFRPMTDLILTADVQWTNWSQVDEIETEYKDISWSLFMTASGNTITPLKWKDAFQLRFGAEYMLYQNVGLRAGYYYDPSPAPEKTLNILLPSYNFHGLTIGIGYDLGGLVVDFGLEYLLGKERDVNFAKWLYDPEFESAMPGVYDMKILVPNISISYKF